MKNPKNHSKHKKYQYAIQNGINYVSHDNQISIICKRCNNVVINNNKRFRINENSINFEKQYQMINTEKQCNNCHSIIRLEICLDNENKIFIAKRSD